MRTNDHGKDKRFVGLLCKHIPLGLGFREIKRITGLSNDGINSRLKRLAECGILTENKQGYTILSESAKIQLKKTGHIKIPEDNRKTKENNNKDTYEISRRDKGYVILAFTAIHGDFRYRPSLKSEYGSPSMPDVKTGNEMSFIVYNIPGVGVSDFIKIKGPANLDRRIHVGYMELFSYVDFTASEIQQYINDLVYREKPVLKHLEDIQDEPRYTITNPVLLEFVNICLNTLGHAFRRMEETYVYKIWPYEKRGINHYSAVKINGENLSSLYRDWYIELFGNHRFTQQNFSYLSKWKNNLKKLDKKAIKEQREYAEKLVKSYDMAITENYKTIMSEKYSQIHDKYKDVINPLLRIAYPNFVREISGL